VHQCRLLCEKFVVGNRKIFQTIKYLRSSHKKVLSSDATSESAGAKTGTTLDKNEPKHYKLVLDDVSATGLVLKAPSRVESAITNSKTASTNASCSDCGQLDWKFIKANSKYLWTQDSPLSYPVDYSEGVRKPSAPLHVHGLVPIPTHQHSHLRTYTCTMRSISFVNNRLQLVMLNALDTCTKSCKHCRAFLRIMIKSFWVRIYRNTHFSAHVVAWIQTITANRVKIDA